MFMLKIIDIAVGLLFSVVFTTTMFLIGFLHTGEILSFQAIIFSFTCIFLASIASDVIVNTFVQKNEQLWRINYKIYYKFKSLTDAQIATLHEKFKQNRNVAVKEDIKYYLEKHYSKNKEVLNVIRKLESDKSYYDIINDGRIGIVRGLVVECKLKLLNNDIEFLRYKAMFETKELLMARRSDLFSFLIGFVSFALSVLSLFYIPNAPSVWYIVLTIGYVLLVAIYSITSYKLKVDIEKKNRLWFLKKFKLLDEL